MGVMEGSGFEVLGGGWRWRGGDWGTLREEVDGESVLHFECFSLCAPAPLGLVSCLKVCFSLSPTRPSEYFKEQHVKLFTAALFF